MAHDPSGDVPEGTPVARNSTIDAIVAACLVVIGGVVIYEARRLGAEWTSDGPGAGYFPFYIGLILAVCGTAIFVQSVRARASAAAAGEDETFVDSEQLKRVLSVLIPSAVYVGVINCFFGLGKKALREQEQEAVNNQAMRHAIEVFDAANLMHSSYPSRCIFQRL